MSASSGAVPTTSRLVPKRLGIAAAIVGALLTGMVLMSLLQRQRAIEQPAAPPLPPIFEVQGAGDGFQQLHLKTSWAGEDRTPPKPPQVPPAPPALPPPPPLFPLSTQTAALTPAPMGPPPLARTIETPPLAPPPIVQGPTAAAKPEPVKAAPVKTEPVKTEPKEDADWLFADVKGNPKKRQGDAPGPEGRPGGSGAGSRGRQSSLFPAAQWERPARPERVLYQSQIMNAMLLQGIQTGQDGTIRAAVTETVYDRFGLLNVLIPQHSIILGTVAGANVKAGQTVVPISITKIELPDGTDLPIGGNMGSADGKSGVPGIVDNRVPQVILTAILTAVTSIGTRSITGSAQGFQPNLGQEYTANVAESISRSGNKMIERSLSIDPVITVPAQTPITIQLNSNLSLMSEPRIVYK